jgi:sigma-B regulation protein RsbU (phosphoserine phosphatase)
MKQIKALEGGGSEPLSPEKILIVDDNAVNRKLLIGILKKEGYELIEAVDGEEAIELALRELPDLILLDIMMPKKDGYEVCSELKSDSRCVNIPIIFLSAKTQTEDKIKGLELGGSDYVTKPFDRGEVFARVKAQLKIQNLTKRLILTNQELVRKQALIEEDLRAAAGIQQSLLPPGPPDLDLIDVAWRFLPCQRIGGDIFNMLRLDEDHWCLYMLDVSGHGVPSALVAVSVSQMMHLPIGFLKKKSIESPPDYRITSPAEVLSTLDQEYPIERFEKFFTMSYIVLNTKDGSIRYSNAAHPAPIVLRSSGALELLDKGGTIIGMGGVMPFDEGEGQLRFGDKLFMYTDGIVEYEDRSGAFYGEDRFYQDLLRLKDKRISHIIDGIVASMMDFGKSNEPRDDITLFGLEFRGMESS